MSRSSDRLPVDRNVEGVAVRTETLSSIPSASQQAAEIWRRWLSSTINAEIYQAVNTALTPGRETPKDVFLATVARAYDVVAATINGDVNLPTPKKRKKAKT